MSMGPSAGGRNRLSLMLKRPLSYKATATDTAKAKRDQEHAGAPTASSSQPKSPPQPHSPMVTTSAAAYSAAAVASLGRSASTDGSSTRTPAKTVGHQGRERVGLLRKRRKASTVFSDASAPTSPTLPIAFAKAQATPMEIPAVPALPAGPVVTSPTALAPAEQAASPAEPVNSPPGPSASLPTTEITVPHRRGSEPTPPTLATPQVRRMKSLLSPRPRVHVPTTSTPSPLLISRPSTTPPEETEKLADHGPPPEIPGRHSDGPGVPAIFLLEAASSVIDLVDRSIMSGTSSMVSLGDVSDKSQPAATSRPLLARLSTDRALREATSVDNLASLDRRSPRPVSARRLSLDVSSLDSPLRSPAVDFAPRSPASFDGRIREEPGGMKRSRSLWARRTAAKDEEDQQSPTFSPSDTQWVNEEGLLQTRRPSTERTPLSERTRVLNVKRAKKMAEVFGTQPPRALYQIKGVESNRDEPMLTPIGTKRASLATFLSEDGFLTPVSDKRGSILTTASNDGHRSSIITILSVSSSEVNLLSPKSARRHSSVQISSVPSTPLPATTEFVLPTKTIHELATELEDAPSLPPFMDLAPSSADGDAGLVVTQTSSEPSPPTSHAWERRRRAAKLTKFFGVDYHAIEPAFDAPAPSAAAKPSPRDPSAAWDAPAVDVKISRPARLWGFMPDPRNRVRETDIQDAMLRLREMRA